MLIELINTGTELMLGRTLNTHQQWLCRRLADLGYRVSRQVAVPDTGPDIQQAVREALGRADLILVTGGLGPTSDDITRDLIAQLLGRPLRQDAAVLAHITDFFASRGRLLPAGNDVQALVPDGAHVLWNPLGTAPGLAIEVSPNHFRADGRPSWLVMLPGPPRELSPMFTELVAPLLRAKLPLAEAFASLTLRTVGIGESALQAQIAAPLQPLVAAGMELGYCAHAGQVDVRLAACGDGATELVAKGENILRALVGESVFGEGDASLESVVVRLLTEQKRTLAVAESCTGGCLAHRLTNVPGASAVFLSGLVTYSNEAKQRFLGVRAGTLAQHGAVSEAVAREMAEGVRRATGADIALSVTGIAGPSGGTEQKPVGTVFLAMAGDFPTVVRQHLNLWEREAFKQVTTNQALEMLRRALVPEDHTRPGLPG